MRHLTACNGTNGRARSRQITLNGSKKKQGWTCGDSASAAAAAAAAVPAAAQLHLLAVLLHLKALEDT
jgi:cobalamin biosynthesis protein CbiD